MPVGDASLGEIVGRQFQSHPVACQHPDSIAAQLTGQVREHGAVLIQLHAEQTTRKFLNDGSGNLNTIFFAQSAS